MNPLKNITESFFKPHTDALTAEQLEWWNKLPKDYQDFLCKNNGGAVPDGECGFETGVVRKVRGKAAPTHTDFVVEFYGLPMPEDDMEDAGIDNVFKLALDNDLDEFLPCNVIAIAYCVSASLVCLSTDGPDKGAVYYWDVNWNTPACKDFFDPRVKAASAPFGNVKAILHNLEDPRYQEAFDALNYATLVKLADSIPQWLKMCKKVKV